ncbi:MAG: hypothetical protein WBD20_09830 [Pirellulaceae bacterium]
MIRFTKWMLAPALAACFLLAGDSPSAQAQGFSLSIGGSSCGGYGAGYGGHYGSGYGSGYGGGYAARPSFGQSYGHGYSSHYGARYAPSYSSRRFHDTSHYHYHPTEVRRHGNHYDVIPGHYDLHRTGHFHH